MKQKEFKTKIEEAKETLKTHKRRIKFAFRSAVTSIVLAAAFTLALCITTGINNHCKNKALAAIRGSSYYATTVEEDKDKLREDVYTETKSLEDAVDEMEHMKTEKYVREVAERNGDTKKVETLDRYSKMSPVQMADATGALAGLAATAGSLIVASKSERKYRKAKEEFASEIAEDEIED